MRRIVVLALIVAAACTSATDTPTPPSAVPSPAVGTTVADGDRLVVLRDDGNLVTMDPDGGELLALTTDAGPTVLVRQPVASPDGRSIAWVEVRPDGARIVTSSRAGGNQRAVPLSIAPFFLAWDPTSRRIAYLGNAGGGVGLGVIDDAVVQPRDVAVGGGTPLYLAWSPDGTHLLVHVGTDGLGTTDLEHPLDPTGEMPGTFQAPAWLPDDRRIYVTRSGGAQAIEIVDGDSRRTLRRFRGGALLEPSPDGRRIAYRLEGADGTTTGMFVQDLDGGAPVRVTNEDTVAFFWSPAGDQLLLLTGDPSNPPLRWRIWRGRERFVGDPFLPSPTFLREYLPFFDQYAQTITPWAPDGSAFAYAGVHDGRAGIWVQPLAGQRRLIASGAFVTWAPTG